MKPIDPISTLNYAEAALIRKNLPKEHQRKIDQAVIDYCNKTPRYLVLPRRKQIKTQEGIVINEIRKLISQGIATRIKAE